MDGFLAPAEVRLRRPSLIGGAAAFLLACVGVSMVPAIAAGATFALVYRIDRRCPAPTVLRGTLAPEREFAVLQMPGGRR